MTLDTNILIAYLDGEQFVVDFILEQKETGRALFIPSVVAAELLSLPKITDAQLQRLRGFVASFIVVPFDTALIEAAAALRRRYGIALPDAIVAATALVRQTPLITRDHGFRKIKELSFIDL